MVVIMTLGEVLDENCPAGFESLPVVYENGWADYEECGHIVVFDFFGELFAQEWGYCVMAEDNSFEFDPQPLQDWEFEELKKEWDKICGEHD
jgi:hypothetical protein